MISKLFLAQSRYDIVVKTLLFSMIATYAAAILSYFAWGFVLPSLVQNFGTLIFFVAGGVAFAIAFPFFAVLLEIIYRTNLTSAKHSNQASSDAMTGLLNRRGFLTAFKDQNKNPLNDGATNAFLMLDVDHYKKINDEYGHSVGDKALISIAEILKKNARSTDAIARLGGEEFGILICNCSPIIAWRAAERVRKSIAGQPLAIEGHTLDISVSIGVALYEKGSDFEQVYQLADRRLYDAKEGGRNKSKMSVLSDARKASKPAAALAHNIDAIKASAGAKA